MPRLDTLDVTHLDTMSRWYDNSTGTTVDVTITSRGTARTPLTLGMEVQIRFVPGHKITAYGNTCADIHTTYPNRDTIEFHVRAALPFSNTFLLVGHRKRNVQLPFPIACTLLLDPIAILPGPTTDLLGRSVIRMQLPNLRFRILTQAAVHLPVLGVTQLTNGLDMEIVKR